MENTDVTRKIREFLKDFSFISAADYIAAHPGSGRAHISRPFGLPWYEVNNCLCAGLQGQVVMPLAESGGGRVVLRESFNYDHEDDILVAALSSALRHSEDAAILDEAVPLYPVWSLGNIWHWFFDSAPKVLVMEAAGYTGPYIVNTSNPVIREGIALLGISRDRVLDCAVPRLLRRALLPGVVRIPEINDMATLFWSIRERVLERAGTLEGSKRCFIRRIGIRRLANEEEFADLMARYDVEVLVPEEHSLAEQFRFMSNSVLTLSPHGANTVLALFQKPKSVLMEFFGYDYVNNNCNIGIIKTLKLLYIPITEKLDWHPEPAPRIDGQQGAAPWRNYRIDVSLAEAVLNNIRDVAYTV